MNTVPFFFHLQHNQHGPLMQNQLTYPFAIIRPALIRLCIDQHRYEGPIIRERDPGWRPMHRPKHHLWIDSDRKWMPR